MSAEGLEIAIPGPPMPMPRARVFVDRGRGAMRAANPARATAWKEGAARAMLAAVTLAEKRVPLFPEGPVRIEFYFLFARPKSRSVLPYWRQGGGDFDNLMKAVADAGKGILWKDDAQVVCGSFEKLWAERGEEACVLLSVGRPPLFPEEPAGTGRPL